MLNVHNNNEAMKKHLLLLTSLLVALLGHGQVIVETRLDTANILIGEQVELQVKCSAGARQKVVFPHFNPQQELTPGVEVVNNGRIDTLRDNGGKRMILTRRYTITAFDSALYSLPPFEVNVDGKNYASHGSIGLKVSTVPVDTTHVDQFYGPNPVVDMPFKWSWRQTGLSLIAIIAALCMLAIWIRRTDPRLITRRIVIQPPTPAHVKAMRGIELIKPKADSADAKAYYMKLTETLRNYLADRFGINAKEMTTQEIIDELTATDHADALLELRTVLLTADLVKFAKHASSLSEQDRSMAQALDYVQTTKLEPAELPKPRVEYETLSGRRQHQLRVAMTVGIYASGTVSLLLTTYVLYDFYCCYGNAL